MNLNRRREILFKENTYKCVPKQVIEWPLALVK